MTISTGNTSAVSAILNPVEAFFGAIGTDVKAWLGQEETVVIDDAKLAWIALWAILSAAGPSQWVILQGLLNTVSKDLAEDNYSGIVADVVSQATTAETAWITTTAVSTLTAMVIALKSA